MDQATRDMLAALHEAIKILDQHLGAGDWVDVAKGEIEEAINIINMLERFKRQQGGP